MTQNIHSFQKDLENFRVEMTRASRQEKDLDRRLTTVEKNVTTGINAPGRTVSIGPNPNDISTLRNRDLYFRFHKFLTEFRRQEIRIISNSYQKTAESIRGQNRPFKAFD